jgi:hypothetical protein
VIDSVWDSGLLEFLAEALFLPGCDMRIVVMDLLRKIGYQGETYLNALYAMEGDEECGSLAMLMIDEMAGRVGE